MNLPGYRLHRLKGNRAGTWSVTVSGNWRVTFTFEGEDAERRPVTTDMAHRLARAFGTSPEMWLGLQQDVDLWDTHHARRAEYDRIKRVPTSKAA